MSSDELLRQICAEFPRRKFAVGLAIAFIDFLLDLGVPALKLQGYKDFLRHFPRQEKTRGGGRANTLIVKLPNGETRSIRRFYDDVQKLIRGTHARHDYPSAAPHATQGWVDYTPWISAMVEMSATELAGLRQGLLDFVLKTLPSHAIDPSKIERAPLIFLKVLTEFDFGVQPGEPTGAAFQGAVFAYLRADAPHLQVEVRKVRTGSMRIGAIADIDAWDGDRLVISAEAKHYIFTEEDCAHLGNFSTEVLNRKALGLVVAEEISSEAEQKILELGLIPISRQKLVDFVSLWDPLKQRIAAQAFLYYASHVEQNGALITRIKNFLKQFE